MTDLTAITTPFGLLDRETQEALKEHGGPYEVFTNFGWGFWGGARLEWHDDRAIRVKPAPPKPREWWLLLRANGEAKAYTGKITACGCHDQIIHVREVLP